MKNYTGQYLQSTAALDGTDFEKAILFIAEDNEKGSTGFIINKPFPRKLNELVEFKDALPFPLYTGGPVVTDGIFMLHRRPDIIEVVKRSLRVFFSAVTCNRLLRLSMSKALPKPTSNYLLVIVAGMPVNCRMKWKKAAGNLSLRKILSPRLLR